MHSRNEVTLNDIAKALDLSASTISRALNGSGPVDTETRSRIAQAARDLGYRHTGSSSRLRPRRSQLLSAVVTQINSTLSSCVVSGAEAVASQLGFGMILNQSMNNEEVRASILENLKKQSVDGILVTSAYFQEYAMLEQIANVNIPAVIVEASSLLPSRPKKKVSDFDNAYELTHHLIEKGCQRIAYLSVNLDKTRHTNLLSGYQNALKDSKVQEADKFVINSQVDNYWKSMAETISMVPGADGIIFACNSITAVAFAPNASTGKLNEFWITSRKTNISKQNMMLLELGKLAAVLLISLSERSPIVSNVN